MLIRKNSILLILSFGILSASFALEWKPEFVDGDTSGQTGFYNFIAVDPDGHLHITYRQAPYGRVKYAYRNSSQWLVEYVVDGGGPASIKIDKMRRPYTIYIDADWNLYCIYRNGSAWQLFPPINLHLFYRGDYGGGISLDLDSLDRPCIAYVIGSTGYLSLLRYAFWDGDTWRIETADSIMDTINNYYHGKVSLKLDRFDRPHIAADFQISDSYSEVRYVHFDGSKWKVDIAADTGFAASLDLDSQNRPHIAYLGYNPTDSSPGLIHAFLDGSTWRFETVDTLFPFGGTIKLCIDSKDRPRIAYSQPLRYAFWDGKTWQKDTVASEVWWGDLDMDLDIQDNPHISYYGTYQGKTGIIYAKGSPGTITENSTIPNKNSLQVYPNPFSRTTEIRYGNRETLGGGVIKIYDIAGKPVKSYYLTNYPLPIVTITWDGLDNNNKPLPSGIYFLKFETEKALILKKIILVK